MRAVYSARLPGLAAVYGIRPWEVGLLSPAEFENFVDRLPEGW